MSKPEFWWCVKDSKGNLLINTAQKDQTDGFMMQEGESIVRIRVEELSAGGEAMSKPTKEKALEYLRRWNVGWTLFHINSSILMEKATPEELRESEEVFQYILGLVIKFGEEK